MSEARYREAERRLWASVGVTPTEQRVRLERTGLTVRVQEVGQGPAVVLVHGASNSGTSWAGLVARLDGFRCLLLPGPAARHRHHAQRAPRRAPPDPPVPGMDERGLLPDDPDHVAATARRFLGGP